MMRHVDIAQLDRIQKRLDDIEAQVAAGKTPHDFRAEFDQLLARMHQVEKHVPAEVLGGDIQMNLVKWCFFQSALDDRDEAWAAMRIALRLAQTMVDSRLDESGLRNLAQRIVNILFPVLNIPK